MIKEKPQNSNLIDSQVADDKNETQTTDENVETSAEKKEKPQPISLANIFDSANEEPEKKLNFFQKIIKSPFWKLWSNRAKIGEHKIPNNLKQFLPPSLEVLETPPHPAPRIFLLITISIFLVAIIWAFVGKIDIITVAEGKIIPGGKVKQIQPYERGVVTKILVAEGQMVEAGEILIELDQTQTDADEIRLEEELNFFKRSALRKEILVDLLKQSMEMFPTWDEFKNTEVFKRQNIEENALLFEEWRSIASQTETLKSQLKEREADLKTSQEIVKQYTATLPLIEKRVAIIKGLFDRDIATLAEYLNLEEERLRQHHTLEGEKARSEQLVASILTVEKQLQAQKSQSLSEVLKELEDFKRQERVLKQELAKAEDLGNKQFLYSPVKGTVKGLEINTVGGVVTPAQILMEVVPMGEKLEVEAFVNNQDIGYVVDGQSAEVKINTFPFTKYGIIEAKVEFVARDATVDEKLGLIYRTKLVLAKNTIMVDGKETPLMPGMGVSAEIATGQRRLIEFFLAPLLKMKQESLRER